MCCRPSHHGAFGHRRGAWRFPCLAESSKASRFLGWWTSVRSWRRQTECALRIKRTLLDFHAFTVERSSDRHDAHMRNDAHRRNAATPSSLHPKMMRPQIPGHTRLELPRRHAYPAPTATLAHVPLRIFRHRPRLRFSPRGTRSRS